MSTEGARFRIEGRVQGVAFRAATRAMAVQLELRGHARNCADGSVEVLAGGTSAALDALEHWLWRGPPAARVTAVRREAAAAPAAAGFHVV